MRIGIRKGIGSKGLDRQARKNTLNRSASIAGLTPEQAKQKENKQKIAEVTKKRAQNLKRKLAAEKKVNKTLNSIPRKLKKMQKKRG